MASSSNMIEVLGEGAVDDWSRRSQEVHGDSKAPRGMVLPSGLVDVDSSPSDLKGLKTIVDRLANEALRSLTIQYGWIVHLLYVPVQPALIRALVNFWSPVYKCFTFGEHDLTPTLEEYHQLLNIPLTDGHRVYVYNKDEKPWRQLARMVGKQSDDIREWRSGHEFDTSKMLAFADENRDNEKGLKMIALLVYGLVLFPKRQGKVDPKVVLYFTRVVQRRAYGENPIIGILAETFRSLDKCRMLGGRFEGCTQLLCIWALSHLHCPERFNFPRVIYNKAYDPAKNYINDFVKVGWPKTGPSRRNWLRFLERLGENQIQWVAKWNIEEEAIFRCGDYLWVPLLVPWGGIGYAPCMVRRQFGARQFVPVTAGLGHSNFSYEEPGAKNKVQAILVAWGKIRKVDRFQLRTIASDGHRSWVQSRERRFTVLEGSEELMDLDIPINPAQEIEIDRLQRRILELEVENQWIKEERDSISDEYRYYLDTTSIKIEDYDNKIRELQDHNYVYQQEGKVRDEQIIRATKIFRTIAARAGSISRELTSIQVGLAVSNAQGAELYGRLNDLIEEMAHYGEFN
ncbi:uncharacterized protein [Euphorbia lathyris]|uniref:uncharacterized protein n=1 Tax=Euphorbia lathyris TaxID=212925 RepID=UPI0033130BAA